MSVLHLYEPYQIKPFPSMISCDTSNSSRLLENSEKKKSRVSLKLSQIESPLIIREYEELIREGYEDNETIPQYSTEQSIIFPQQLPIVVMVKIYIHVEIGFNQKTFTVNVNSERTQPIGSLIPLSIKYFNQCKYNIDINDVNEVEVYTLELQANDYSVYSFYSSKKNLKPKLDYPPYDLKTSIGTANSDAFSLVFPKESLIMKRIDKEEELANPKGCRKGCAII